jgi:hypothetical protein
MRIRALSVFEGIIYHCQLMDGSNPARPRLEVEAILRPGDADAEAGPLLLSVAEYMVMVNDTAQARAAVRELDRRGRIVERMGVRYLTFPTWEWVGDDALLDPSSTSGTSPSASPTPETAADPASP